MNNYITEVVLNWAGDGVCFSRRNGALPVANRRTERHYKPTPASKTRLERAVECEVNAGRAYMRVSLPLIFIEPTE